MAKGKSVYQFNVADPAATEQIIQQWLSANQFQPISDNGAIYYQSGDALTGYHGLDYQISDNIITINAYLGSYKKPMQLSDGFVGSLQITTYKNKLNELFSALSQSSPAMTSTTSRPSPSATTPPPQQLTNIPDFQQSINKKNNTFAEISFWISLAMLLTSFTGVIYGAIIILFNYWMAAQGLKSKKRGKAIAAIVISSAAIAIFIVKLIIKINK